MSESTLKVAIVDPSPIVRSGLSVMLKRIQGIMYIRSKLYRPNFFWRVLKRNVLIW